MQKTFLFTKIFSDFFVSVGGNAYIGFGQPACAG